MDMFIAVDNQTLSGLISKVSGKDQPTCQIPRTKKSPRRHKQFSM